MEIEVFVDPEHAEAAALQADLAGELTALQRQGITITTKTSPPPPQTLGTAEAYQFIIQHHEELVSLAVLLKAVLDVIFAVLRRRSISPIQQPPRGKPAAKQSGKAKPRKKTSSPIPILVIRVGDATLTIPSTPSKEASFVVEVTGSKKQVKRKAAESQRRPPK